MLSKQTQRKLAVYFSAMIFLHSFFLWRSRHDIAIGLPDFSAFYTAGKIVQEGQGRQLYDLALQAAVQRTINPAGFSQRGALLPYNHPPFEALAFFPLAHLSYLGAYVAWVAINLGLLAIVIALLRKSLPILGKQPLYLWLLACFSFTPIFIALMQGQDSIVLLFCDCMAFLALRRKADFQAGIWLGLGLFKFQLVLPLVFPFLLLKQWRVLGGFASAAVALTLIGLPVAGWQGTLAYPRYIWALEHDTKLRSLVGSEMTPNLHGLISSFLPARYSKLSLLVLLIVSAGVLAAITLIWHRALHANLARRQLAFAAALIAAVLLSYHSWIHDLSILFLAVLLIAEALLSRHVIEIRHRAMVWACMALLFCAPVYFVEMLQFKQFPLIAGVVLVFFFVIAKSFGPCQPEIA